MIHRTCLPISALVLVLVLAAAAQAGAATMYVNEGSQACADNGPGTIAQPFCTISAAAAAATAGTTVLVSAGTYDEQVSVARSGNAPQPVVFRAQPGQTVIVRGGQYGFYVSARSWITIDGFHVTDTTSDGIHISSNSAHVKVLDNTVTSAGQPASGLTAKGISLTNVTDSVVDGNTVTHNSNYGIYLVQSTGVEVAGNELAFNAKQFSRAASGIRLHSSPGNTISRNVSHDNEDSGIELVTGSDGNLVVDNVCYGNGDHGIDNLDARNQRIVANSVYRNVTAGINAEGGSTGAVLANNISVDNGIDSPRTKGNIRVDAQSTAGTSIDYDLVHLRTAGTAVVWGSSFYSSLGAMRAATGQEPHGVEADPGWLDAAAGDLHLTAGSPAIDSANSGASGQTQTDADGSARVDDPAVANTGAGPRAYDDRGAYEFLPGPSPPSATLAVTPASGPVNLAVTADASGSSDPDGTIVSYRFNFGDGSPAVGPQSAATAAHTYTRAGTFTVTVTVTDNDGLSSTATKQVTAFGGDQPPSAALSVTPSAGLVSLQVTADASASSDAEGPIASYTFDFGDGSPIVGPQTGATAGHTYTSAGTYTVTLTVRDSAGQPSQATAEVIVRSNLVGNPGFETGTSGWNTSGGGTTVSLARVAGGHSGGWAAQLTNTGTAAATCLLNDSPNWVPTSSSGTYAGTLWVRADTAGAALKLRFREYSGSTLLGSQTAQATLTTSWQPVTVTYAPAAPGASTLDFNAYVVGAAPGACFYADDAVIDRQ
jgi:parallel beta-helix repeat protein